MKHLLFPLFLLMAAGIAPLFAFDDGGDGTSIPDYRELVREGYGPRRIDRDRDEDSYRVHVGVEVRPVPTQAYYANGYTIFYGYRAVPERVGSINTVYAFGYPADFYRHLMPADMPNLDRYVLSLARTGGNSAAKAQPVHHADAISTVQSTTAPPPAKGVKAQPAVVEKPAH